MDLSKEFMIRVKADINQAVTKMEQMTREIERQGHASNTAAGKTKSHSRALQNLTSAIAGYFTIATAVRGIKLADEFASLQQRIRTATKETEDYNRVSMELFEITQRNGAELKDTIDTFQRLSIARKELQATNSEILKVTEAVQQLGIQSGASSSAMSAGQLQFAQAMSAGVVRAEELNSIIENLPAVADRIARGLNMTVGELRAAVLEGKVLSRDVFNSLLTQAPEISKEMEDIPVTLERATTILGNSVQGFLDALNQANNITGSLSDALIGTANILDNTSANMNPEGRYQFNELVRMRLATMEEIARLEELGINSRNSKLSILKENLATLTKEIERIQMLNIQAERGFNDTGNAGISASKLTTEEQQRLGTQLDQVKVKLSEQLALFNKQKKTLADTKQATADFETSVSQAQDSLASGGQDSLGLGDIVGQINKAKAALSEGDNKQAVQEAEKALEIIQQVAKGGDEVQGILEFMLQQAAKVGREASQGLVEQEQAAFEQIKTSITSLLAEAQELKTLKVGFDQDAAKQEAEFLRATLQEEFNNNPLELPVVLKKPETTSATDKQASEAIDGLPAKADGGLLVGPGTGTSDSILMRGSNGEYMIREAAVRHYGVPFMNMLNRKQLPRYADGGLIGRAPPSLPDSTPQPASVGGRPLTIVLDGQRYSARTDNATAERLSADLHMHNLKGGSKT